MKAVQSDPTGTKRGRPGPESVPTLIDDLLRRQGWMDGVADALQRVLGAFYGVLGAPGRALKNLLHGTRILGHPLHPAVTDIPLGAWAAGVAADWAAHVTKLVPSQAGDVALAVGILAGLLAFASGYTDFHDTIGQERRYGLTHGVIMTTTIIVMLVSLGVRWLWGGEGSVLAAVISTAGLLLGFGGAFFGGHLTFGFGTQVNHLAFAEGPKDYVRVGKSEDFPEGSLKLADAGGMAVMVVRLDGQLNAIADICTHAGGPLHEGKLDGDVVTCPWHGSRFCVRNGRALSGPATFDEPVLQVREDGGEVEVKLARPLH
ncbi:MAG: non-heme iron oxygenase ferredoxin subunit [Candidatus Dormiibacterota bacterium]